MRTFQPTLLVLLFLMVVPMTPAGADEGAGAGAAVTLRLSFPDGKPAVGAVATAGGRKFVADGQGVVNAGMIPEGTRVASGDIVRSEGGIFGLFRKRVRYAGFLKLEVKAGAPLDARLTLLQTEDIDRACRSCHPEKGKGRGDGIKCAHRSGVPVKPAQAARVSEFNRENDNLRKSGRQAYPPILLAERKEKGWFSDRKMYLECESCHTNHVKTDQRAYVLMPFIQKSILCKGCHV